MNIIKYPSRDRWEDLTRRAAIDFTLLHETVRIVLDKVRRGGDEAIRRCGEDFDKVRIGTLRIGREELAESSELLSDKEKDALRVAAENIRAFHAAQRFNEITVETMPGVVCRQKAVPIEKVGLYVPGGTAPLCSTVLMLAVPASLAGCREVVLCTPPDTTGKVHPAILFAAELSGVRTICKVGGIQAIAAMAYGTESIPKVYKIFGPGNRYVTAAKQLISIADTAIDMPAGPSEVEVLADSSANPVFIAADLLSQAEHGVDSQSLLVTTDEALIPAVLRCLDEQLSRLPRREFAAQALAHSRIVLFRDENEAVDFTNAYAPEHLIIQTVNYKALADRILNAGSVFLGSFTPESVGDYASGVNHTLPTRGYARAYSGVNLDSFMKKITFQEITPEGLIRLAPTLCTLATCEQLEGHRAAVTCRTDNFTELI
ncbi:MAG: histidinol dehydrogenase [Tannerellaceae bacterium]|jgi:histidinol dehydrogenase|nr:histidinol dehydrogenase [Tannerellaceae bacterium]